MRQLTRFRQAALGVLGASRAMATARSAIAASVVSRMSLEETHAWRWPISTRRPTSTPSARSACSSPPLRTSIDRLSPATAIASAASAPAARAAASSRPVSAARIVRPSIGSGSASAVRLPGRAAT